MQLLSRFFRKENDRTRVYINLKLWEKSGKTSGGVIHTIHRVIHRKTWKIPCKLRVCRGFGVYHGDFT
jgi:hypothetical protein